MSGFSVHVREKALELGFDVVGIAPAGEVRHASAFQHWLEAGHQADMAWLARHRERRTDPRQVVSGARSVVMAGFNYFREDPPPELWDDPLRGRVARYAWGPDYHDRLLPRLMELADFLRAEAPGAQCRAYVDTGPLMEKTWAAEAGIGFIGKNTLLIHPRHGSYLLLGGVITDLEFEYDPPATDDGARSGPGHCGRCSRCLSACPTGALIAPRVLDSRRCISYLTIEHKEAIPEDLRPLMGQWIFGCDACQTVCPWVRRYAHAASDRFLAFDAERFAPDLLELMGLDAAAFRRRYKGTPVTRAKRRGLLRNAAIALGNAGRREALPVLRRALEDEEPLIRLHADWAIRAIERAAAT